jgi:hypothetical protein
MHPPTTSALRHGIRRRKVFDRHFISRPLAHYKDRARNQPPFLLPPDAEATCLKEARSVALRDNENKT